MHTRVARQLLLRRLDFMDVQVVQNEMEVNVGPLGHHVIQKAKEVWRSGVSLPIDG